MQAIEQSNDADGDTDGIQYKNESKQKVDHDPNNVLREICITQDTRRNCPTVWFEDET